MNSDEDKLYRNIVDLNESWTNNRFVKFKSNEPEESHLFGHHIFKKS
jgi:hypothetical protein